MKTTKIMKNGRVLSYVVVSIIFLTSCQTTNQGGRTYTTSQAMSAMRSFPGIILNVEEVQIQHNETGVGAVAGAVLGGVVGSTIGSGRGTTLATAGGAAAGAAAGSAGERMRGTRPALEIEVELEGGDVLVIVQEKDDVFEVGDHVRVIEGRDGSYRIRQ